MAPSLRTCRLSLVISALLIMLGTASVSAQWAVYDMRMVADQESSVNFTHYTGAYLVTPLVGVAASLVFTTEEEGRYYAVAENAAKFFVAGNQTKRRAVISATANGGTSQSMYLASGPLNNTFQYTLRGERSVAIIASDLYGYLMTADDEHLSSIPAIDGSLGVVGIASFKGFFRKDLSDRLNTEAPTMGQAVESIASLLEKYGYQSETESQTTSTASAPKAIDPVVPVQSRKWKSLCSSNRLRNEERPTVDGAVH